MATRSRPARLSLRPISATRVPLKRSRATAPRRSLRASVPWNAPARLIVSQPALSRRRGSRSSNGTVVTAIAGSLSRAARSRAVTRNA
jgi:hypothetical protein